MEDARLFLKELYGELKEGEFIEIRSVGKKPNRMFMKNPDAAVTAAAGLAQSSDVFFGVATRDGRGGKKGNIVRIPAVWVDLDNKEGYPPLSERLLRIEDFPTSAVIASGSGLHLYWFLDHFAGPDQIPLIEKINKTMAMRIGGDTAFDATRCLRVPGTLNHKYPPEPREVKVSSFHPEYRFTTEHLCAYLEIGAGGQGSGVRGEVTSKGHDRPGHAVQVAGSPDILSCASPSSGPSGSAPLPCRDIIWRGVAEGGRNNACFQLALDLKRQSVPVRLAVELLSRWNTLNLPPMEPSQVATTVEAVYRGDYTGLGCDKSPMKDFCSVECAVRARGRVTNGGGRGSRVETREWDGVVPHSPDPQSPSPVPSPRLWRLPELMNREIPPVEFVVDPLIPKMGVTLVTGEGGIGKSFIMIELARSVASGVPFLGHFPCEQGAALMVDMENHDFVIAGRAKKLFAGHDESLDAAIYGFDKGDIEAGHLNIDSETGRDALAAALDATKPVLTTVDPLVALHSSDENDNVAMRSVIRRLQSLARQYSMAVVVVHHPRKRGVINDAGQMIRGASDLRNSVDSHLFMRRVSKDRILLEHDKSRHAPAIEKVLIEMSDTDDGTATCFRFAGGATEAEEKSADARESVLRILGELGRCKRKELIGRLKAEGLTRVTIDRTLAGLVVEGVVSRPSYGQYALEDQAPLLEA